MTKAPIIKLNSSIQFIPGVGPKKAAALEKIGIETVENMLYYLPRRYLDRSTVRKIEDLSRESGEVTVIGKVMSFGAIGARGSHQRFVLRIGDETGVIEAVFFQGVNYWSQVFSEGERVAISGRVTYYAKPQIIHPAVDRLKMEDGDSFWNTGRIISLYPSAEEIKRARLDSRGIRKIVRAALDKAGDLVEDYLPPEIVKANDLMSLGEALENVHFPLSMEKRDEAVRRLKYEELFFLQLMLAMRRHRDKQPSGVQCDNVGEITKKFVDSLTFKYTPAQLEVLKEIRRDMESPASMNRLLQGDVGSGKTIVALTATVMAIESGYQAALMAPTEILAEQHFLTAKPLLEPLGITIAMLKGGQRRNHRDALLADIQAGRINLIVGTHALIQEKVEFANLGLAIIDEQHRFGVMQRSKLREKGRSPDVLVMTATPIPRTLALTVYGDLDVSIIRELPPGRGKIITRFASIRQQGKIYDYLRKELARRHQAYIIYPLVEESDRLILRAAENHYRQLKNGEFRGNSIALLHGRMNSEEKEAVIADFKAGKTQILVATTVVEVGVDIPNATFMIIEEADRYGLLQLHQLRGRIGRGEAQSYCYLMSDTPLSKEARRRIRTMEETIDGFDIAEIDLEMRGAGEFFGARQHGLPELKYAHPIADRELMMTARTDAFRLVETDPDISNCPKLYKRFRRLYKDKLELVDVA